MSEPKSLWGRWYLRVLSRSTAREARKCWILGAQWPSHHPTSGNPHLLLTHLAVRPLIRYPHNNRSDLVAPDFRTVEQLWHFTQLDYLDTWARFRRWVTYRSVIWARNQDHDLGRARLVQYYLRQSLNAKAIVSCLLRRYRQFQRQYQCLYQWLYQ